MPDSAIRSFGRWISSCDWAEVMNSSDVNEKCDIFLHTLRSSIETHFPLRKVKFHPSEKPWMTPRIKGLIFDRQQAFYSGNTSMEETQADSCQKHRPGEKATLLNSRAET